MNSKKVIEKISETLMCVDSTTSNEEQYSFLGSKTVGALMFYTMKTNCLSKDVLSWLIDNIINEIKTVTDNQIITFSDGLFGYGWLIHFIERNKNVKFESQVFYKQLDSIASSFIEKELDNGHYDFLHGALGAGVYLLERHSVDSKMKEIESLFFKLKSIGIEDENTFFICEPLFLKNKDEDTVNLGLSHGMASIVVFFSHILRLETTKKLSDECKKLLIKTVQFILDNKNVHSQSSIFPNYVVAGELKEKDSRLAWCYGDLGICTAIWQAGEVLNNISLKQEAIDICLNSISRRDLGEEHILDAGLCHGTAGIAHIYNRMYFNTKKHEFKKVANYWIEETIKMSRFEDGLAGFKSWNNPEYGGWQNDYGLLEGISGIGLVLLSHVDNREPIWDRMLLLS